MVTNTIRTFPERIIIFAGAYGSGKTEVAVNYALKLSADSTNQPLSIIDLDIVNRILIQPHWRLEYEVE